MAAILIVEDDARVGSFIEKGLSEHQHQVTLVSEGKSAIAQCIRNDYDIIVLDIMLPDITGFDVCTLLRSRGTTASIIMLSAMDSPEEKVKGLQSGADDYLSKPFFFDELLERIKAQIRRQQLSGGFTHQHAYDEIELDERKQEARRAGKMLQLSPTEFKLLLHFLNNREKVLSRTILAQAVWGLDFDTRTNVVDVYINYLRNKLDKPFTHPLIHTVRNRDFMLIRKDDA